MPPGSRRPPRTRASSGSASLARPERAPFPRSRRRRAAPSHGRRACTRRPGARLLRRSRGRWCPARRAGAGSGRAAGAGRRGSRRRRGRGRSDRPRAAGDRALRRAAGLPGRRVASRRWRAWATLTMQGCPMPALRILDDRQRELIFLRPPRRIVSLVPSETQSVLALGAGDRLVGRTRYCDAPESVPLVGGTKDVDVEAVARLRPELILANQEENSRVHLEQLAQLGLPLFVSFPKTVAEGLAHLGRLAKVLEVDARDLLRRGYGAVQEAEAALGKRGMLRAFVPIWMDPLMTVNGQTYLSDALRLGGGENVFAERQRLYPLAADLGQAVPLPAGTRDTRYPRVALDEVVKRAPRIVLLPDEPHPFSERDAEVFRAALPPGTKVVRCGGRDFSWYGAQSVEGVPRLRALIDSLR